MEREYNDQNPVPVRHTLATATERHLSQMSFKAADRAVNAAAGLGFKLTPEEQDSLRLRIADEVEKELRKVRRGE